MQTRILNQAKVVAANASGRLTFFPPDATRKWKVLSISLCANETSTAHATDYADITPYKDTASPTALAAARSTNSGTGSTLTQGVPFIFVLTAAGSNLEISQADPLYLLIDATPAAGVAVDVSVQVEIEEIRV